MKKSRAGEAGIVRSNLRAARDHRILKFELSKGFGEALPGQFVMIRKSGAAAPLLPRPFSIYSLQDLGDTVAIELLYRVVGIGTELLASCREGDGLEVLGPLGRGFQVASHLRRVVLIAGGVGVAPLHFLAQHCRTGKGGLEIIAYLGARTADHLAGLDRLEGVCHGVITATDDGSRGYHGMVTDRFREDLPSYGGYETALFACGPRPMMRSLALLAAESGLRCQVSLEERMACGFGVCRGCAVKVRSGDARQPYRPACTDGPVFDSVDIDWDDC